MNGALDRMIREMHQFLINETFAWTVGYHTSIRWIKIFIYEKSHGNDDKQKSYLQVNLGMYSKETILNATARTKMEEEQGQELCAGWLRGNWLKGV